MAVNPQDIIQRKSKLAAQRQIVERTWESCYDYSHPLVGAGFSSGYVSPDSMISQGNAKTAALLDSTATEATRTLSAALVSGVTPSNSRWIEFGEPREEEAGDPSSRWLDNAADRLWRKIHASNYDSIAPEVALDIVCAGMAAFFIDEDQDKGGFVFEHWPLQSCYFAASRASGPVDTVYRCFNLTAEQAMDEYEGRVSAATREKASKSTAKDEPVEFIHAIYPREPGNGYGQLASTMPVASCHVEVEAKFLARESGYQEMPVVVPRWKLVGGSQYAFGPMRDCLPNCKTLNLQTEYILKNMALRTSGVWGAVDDGVLNPKTVRLGSGKVIVMAAKDNLWSIPPPDQFDSAMVQVEILQKAIRRVLMADVLEPQDGPQKTAYEVYVRVEQIRQILSPVYGRLVSEWVRPMTDRCFGVALRAGLFGMPPQELRGVEFITRSTSPIARAQRAVDVHAMDQFEGALGLQAQAGLADAFEIYDWDAARRERASLVGVKDKLILDSRALAALRQKKQQAQQQAAIQGAALQQLSKAA